MPILSSEPRDRRWPRELVLLVVVTAAINFCGITWGLPSDGTDWAIDSIAPLGPLAYGWKMLHGAHWWSKYPPLHFTLLAVVYAPYLAYLSATGRMIATTAQYPYGMLDPTASLAALTLIARSVSALMGIGTAVAAYLVARDLAGRRAGFCAGLLFAGSPLAVYYAGTGNLDMPYMFWSSLALLFLVRTARGGTTRTYVALGVTAAAAVATKDQAYGLFLLLPIPLLAMRVREHGVLGIDRRPLAGAAAAVVTYVVASNLAIDLAGWLAHVRFITGPGSAPYQMFPRTADGYAALATRTAQTLADVTTLPVIALAAIGVGWTLRRRIAGASLLLFAVCSYLLLFVGPILYVFPRFMLPPAFAIAIFAGIGAAALWRLPSAPIRSAVAVALLYAFSYGTSMDLGFLWDSRYSAEQWLAQNLEPDAVVGTDAPAAYLPRLPAGARTTTFSITDERTASSVDAPSYLILTDAQYRKYFRHQNLRTAIEHLLAGRRGYEPVASFYQPGLPATDLIPSVNPRIVIMRRQSTAGGLSSDATGADEGPPKPDADVHA